MSGIRDFIVLSGDIRILAMDAVVREPPEYFLRFIFRWYSRTFHTPLHHVERLPLEDVLQAYYEVKYEDMPEHEIEHEIKMLLETEEELRERRRLEDQEEAESLKFAREAAAQEASKVPESVVDRLAAATDKFQQAIKNLQPPETLPGPDTKLPDPKPTKLPPDIKMTFIEEDGFDDLLDKDFASRTQDDEE